MQSVASVLPYVHIGLAVLLITSILLQQTSAGLGEAFGGGSSDVGFHTRRGAEKMLFRASLTFAILFTASIIAALFIR